MGSSLRGKKAGARAGVKSRASAIAWVRLVTWSLPKIVLVWVLTVLMAITSVRATSALDLPFAIRRSTSSSRALSGSTSDED